MAAADPCANCGAPLGGARFCGACGQQRALPLEAWRIARDSAGQMVDLEGPWLRTLRELTLRPGAMVRRYVAGERQRFVNPILYAVTAATVLLLAMHALGVDIGTLQGVEESRHEDFNLVLRSLGYLAVIGALPVAALMRLALRGRTVGELYVLLLYAYGQLMLWQVGLYALGAGSDLYAFWASRVASGIFFGWVFTGYFGWRPARAVLAGLAAYVTMLGTLLACGAGLIAAKTVVERITG